MLALQGVFVGQPNPEDPGEVDITFTTAACALPARAGDVLELSGFVLQVVVPGQLVGATVKSAQVVALAGDIEQFGPSFGLFKTTWSPDLGADPECFVRFNPLPGSAPNQSVSTQASVLVSFSEPMDPASVQALDTSKLTYQDPPVPGDPIFANVTTPSGVPPCRNKRGEGISTRRRPFFAARRCAGRPSLSDLGASRAA